MNRLIFIFLLGFSVLAQGQSIYFSPSGQIESTNNINDWISDYAYIHNNSGASIELNFQTISNTMNSIGWDNLLCTNTGCFSYVPASGSLGVIANGDSGYLNLHSGFVGIAGTGIIKVKVFEAGNNSNADTITFIYHTTTTSVINEQLVAAEALSQNYPNPVLTNTTFQYHLPASTGSFIVTDCTGKLIISQNLYSQKGSFTIGEGLPKGIFFCMLYDEKGMQIAGRKFIVQ